MPKLSAPSSSASGYRRTAEKARRVAFVLLALPLLHGCGFGVPLKQPTVVPQQAGRSATIRLGEATRDDVRAALGEPRLESDFWRVEIYRSDDKQVELAFVGVIVIPVPLGVFSEKRHGYVVVTYDEAGRVSQVASGVASDGFLATDSASWMAIHADTISFVIDPVGTKMRSTLLADSSRLAGYLAERRRAGVCTLVVACDGDEGCPDAIAIDGGDPFDPSPLSVLCGPDSPCPRGSRPTANTIADRRFVLVPVLHAIEVAPGRHALQATRSRIKGGGEASFECAPGEVLYGAVRSRVEGASWASRGRLEVTVSFSTVPPEAWASFGVELARDFRWLVTNAPDARANP